MATPNKVELASRVRGCVLGSALGDAIGGPFEFGPLERVPALTGDTWIDGLYPYERATGAHGVWPTPPPEGTLPPPGTGTDDTRYDWLFLELATGLGRMPSAQDLAVRYLQIYKKPDIVFPGHAELTRVQFAHWEGVCRGYLGQASELYRDLPPDILLARSLGLNYPVLSGLIALTLAGLLFPGQPEQAYRAAFQADFYDIGYAREAVGLLAASVGLVIAQEVEPEELFDRVVGLDPLHLGGEFGGPFVIGHLPALYPTVTDARSDREVARALSAALRTYHPFDAFKALAIALLAAVAAGGDPLRAILIAANHVGMDEDGRPTRYEDIDCYASIAGAIAGAMRGAEAFPPHLLRQVVESNKAVHGFDLNAAIDRFIARCLP